MMSVAVVLLSLLLCMFLLWRRRRHAAKEARAARLAALAQKALPVRQAGAGGFELGNPLASPSLQRAGPSSPRAPQSPQSPQRLLGKTHPQSPARAAFAPVESPRRAQPLELHSWGDSEGEGRGFAFHNPLVTQAVGRAGRLPGRPRGGREDAWD